MKVRCNRTEECKKRFPDRQCGAWLVHYSDQCEPCPFSKPGNAECVKAYCSFDETNDHRHRVRALMDEVTERLAKRGMDHDLSKLGEPEKDWFDRFTPKLKDSAYGSEEYKGFLKELSPALDHHYAENRHHPEHHEDGVNSMNLLDLIELLADWKAASERHTTGNLAMSILLNEERFELSVWLKDCLLQTAEDLGWWDGVMPEECGKCEDPFMPDQDFILCPKCRERDVVHTIDRPEVPPQEAEITIEITKPVEEENDGSNN